MPYLATATSTSAGKNGLFVIPSNNIATTPTFVSTTATRVLSYAFSYSDTSSGVISGYSPYAVIYAAGPQLYGLKLADTTAAPTPVQISSLALPSAAAICASSTAQTNILDPTTTFVVLDVAGSGGCFTSGDTFELVHYSDSASTAPQALAVHSSTFYATYRSDGTLGGVVVLDPTTQILSFYAGASFTNPVTIVSKVSAITPVHTIYSTSLGITSLFGTSAPRLADGALFLSVVISGTQTLYRIDATGKSSSVYTAQGVLPSTGQTDDNNLYFTDLSSTTELILQEPLAGGPAVTLYSGTPSISSSTGSITDRFIPLASTDSRLLVVDSTDDSLHAVNVGAAPFSYTSVAAGATTQPALQGTAAYSPPGDLGQTVALGPFGATAGVIAADGSVLQQRNDGSFFLFDSILGYAPMLVPTTNGYSVLGYDIAGNAFAAHPYQNTSGGTFVTADGGAVVPLLLMLTGNTGSGTAYSASGFGGSVFAFDRGTNTMVEITMPSTTIADPFW
jgi:hypothetical protein